MSSLHLGIIASNQYLRSVLCSIRSDTMELPYLDVLYQVICVDLWTFSTTEKYTQRHKHALKPWKYIFPLLNSKYMICLVICCRQLFEITYIRFNIFFQKTGEIIVDS